MIKKEYKNKINKKDEVMIKIWKNNDGNKEKGKNLEKDIRKIDREDIVKNCVLKIEIVKDEMEKDVEKVKIDK
jgi:hypothetical protein